MFIKHVCTRNAQEHTKQQYLLYAVPFIYLIGVTAKLFQHNVSLASTVLQIHMYQNLHQFECTELRLLIYKPDAHKPEFL